MYSSLILLAKYIVCDETIFAYNDITYAKAIPKITQKIIIKISISIQNVYKYTILKQKIVVGMDHP